MPTRKDFTLVLLSALATTGLAALAQSAAQSAAQSVKKPPMTSTAIDWTAVQPRASATGSSRKFLDGPTPTLDNLECHASTLNPGTTNHEILKRADDEVIIIKEGTIEAYVGDKWLRVGPGSVIFNAANVDQAMRNPTDAPATYFVVTVRPMAATPPAGK
jgi:mannose-6-phosphate isomerase-like protein (cupin superfamily)